jgi:peptidylprolyl isomerase
MQIRKFVSGSKILISALVLVIITTACAGGPKVEKGSVIKLHYVGTLKDGSQFDATGENRPLTILVGSGQVIPAFEKKITGMHKGQTKRFTIKSKEGYGETDPKKLATLPRDDRFKDLELKEGLIIYANTKQADGRVAQTPMKVVNVSDKEVTLDYNHPLAGKDLNFKVTIEDIVSPQAPMPAAADVNVVDPSAAQQ